MIFDVIGAPGFEPGTSCTPSKRASQAALRPVAAGGFYTESSQAQRASAEATCAYFGAGFFSDLSDFFVLCTWCRMISVRCR